MEVLLSLGKVLADQMSEFQHFVGPDISLSGDGFAER
jgi:hypothetical protein